MYVDKESFVIYMIATSLCIIVLYIFLIKYIKEFSELRKKVNCLLYYNQLITIEELENDTRRKR